MLSLYLVDELIKRALAEDIGTGDVTTLATIAPDKRIEGTLTAKERGVVCGLPIAQRVFSRIDPAIAFSPFVDDGDPVEAGTILAEVSGPAQGILTGERVSLNFLQHLSGIATRTRACVEAVRGTGALITDTRKTTPGLRVVEKYAVACGGGSNHRFNLADGVLIKDNHIRAAGGISQAIASARRTAAHTLKIEVEVENEAMIEEALDSKADIIMLDNMSLAEMAKAVRLIDGRALVEASGNMGDRDLAAVARTGVNLISIGALTHSVRALDISLRFRTES
jgi:nicotinate-nucleotide pyrophosphorylase (carboxylating)